MVRNLAALLFWFACAAGAQSADRPDWVRVSASDEFFIRLPPGSAYIEREGIDSFIGAFQHRGFKVDFDMGAYGAGASAREGDPGWRIERTTIDGRRAYLDYATAPHAGQCDWRIDAVIHLKRGGTLDLYGCPATAADQAVLEDAFKSITFPADR